MKVGMDVLRGGAGGWLAGRRVGLLSHQAAACADGATSAQALRALPGVRLAALFGPEHGFFGQAGPGDAVASRSHPDWGIPVHSLHGAARKPAPEMLAGIDTLVCDLQDLGVRCYTYLATLGLAMEACAEAGVEVAVADRPVPLPDCVDGPVAEPGLRSFVAPYALPMVYGMTPAETARWLARSLPGLRLRTVPMEGWRRSDTAWGAGRPPFLPPSPGIRTWEGAGVYPATVFAEALPGIDCGRGTGLAFRVLGAPWMRGEAFCRRLAGESLPGLAFHPHRYAAAGGEWAGRELDGIRLTVTDPVRFRPVRASLVLLRALEEEYGAGHVWGLPGARPGWFDKLYGCRAAREALQSGAPLDEIFAGWDAAARPFLEERSACLLYE